MHQNNIGSSPRFHSLLPRSGAELWVAHGKFKHEYGQLRNMYKGVATIFGVWVRCAYRNRWLEFFGYCGDPILVLALPEAPAMYVVILDMFMFRNTIV